MTTSVRFCLSYDPSKCDFIAFKMNIISIGNALLTQTLSMTLRVRAKVLLHVWSYDFYDMTLTTESQRHYMISKITAVMSSHKFITYDIL